MSFSLDKLPSISNPYQIKRKFSESSSAYQSESNKKIFFKLFFSLISKNKNSYFIKYPKIFR